MKTIYITWDGIEWDHFSQSYSYTAQFGLADMMSRFSEIVPICILKKPFIEDVKFQKNIMNFVSKSEMKSDIVVVPVCHSKDEFDFFDWVRQCAPIRIAVLTESFTSQIVYEIDLNKLYRIIMENFTHVLVYDDYDLSYFSSKKKCQYFPTLIDENDFLSIEETKNKISFWGTIRNLDHPRDREIKYMEKFENFSIIPEHSDFEEQLKINLMKDRKNFVKKYLSNEINIQDMIDNSKKWWNVRRLIYKEFLKKMNGYRVTFNPFSYSYHYPGRVFESIAAGVPVISREPKEDRFLTRRLFIPNRDILWYKTYEGLVESVNKISSDLSFRNSLIENSRESLKKISLQKRYENFKNWVIN